VTATAAGGGNPSASFHLSNAPGAADHLLLAAPPGASVGTPEDLTVTVQDAFGNTVTGYTGTVQFASSDPGALLPADYTFTADHGQHNFSIIFQTAGVQSITATDTARGTVTGSISLTVGAGVPIQPGQTAGIGFWHNDHGQALIRSFNGGPSATALADWLAATFPNLYGAGAGTHNLTGETNAQVADFFETVFAEHGPKLDAQVLATALNVYATTLSLGGTAGRAYGFVVNDAGLGASVVNVGEGGAAFGVPRGTLRTVLEIQVTARWGQYTREVHEHLLNPRSGNPRRIWRRRQRGSTSAPRDLQEAAEYYLTPRGQHPNAQNKMLMNGLAAWVAFDAFDLVETLLTQPLLVIAGSQAGSLWHSEELYAKAPGPKELFLIEGAGHMDLNRRPSGRRVQPFRPGQPGRRLDLDRDSVDSGGRDIALST
jgi:hypothetical protein